MNVQDGIRGLIIAILTIFKSVGDATLFVLWLISQLTLKTYNIIAKAFSSSLNSIKKFFFRLGLKSYKILRILNHLVYHAKKTIKIPKLKFIRLPHIPKPDISIYIPPVVSNIFTAIKFFALGVIITGVVGFIFYMRLLVTSLPNPTYLSERDIPTSTKIFDRRGTLLYEIYSEENRTPLPLSQIPKVVKDATIAIEDKDFYTHNGFSFKAIARALYHNYTTSDTVEGGSTITQQLVRSALLTPQKTILRKLKEVIISFWAERIYTKDQILEMYLNQVPYGGTSWGVEAASEAYFGKSVKNLNLAEAALLVGLPAAPSSYNPFGSSPHLAVERQKEVLKQMKEQGYITEDQRKEAEKESLHFKTPTIPIAAPHFVMYVKDYLEKIYGPRTVQQGGLRVTTTLDLPIQQSSEKILSEEISKLSNLSVGNGAILVTDPQKGEILAMVGSKDYFDPTFGSVNIATSLRQPGSSIKVINYAAALMNGYTPASLLEDTPITYKSDGQPDYVPLNYDGKYHGMVTLRTALGSSYNIPAVKILNKIGVSTMIDLGASMGIKTWTDKSRYGLSLTLGGGEVTMLDMAEVYSTLARGGERKELTPILKITTWKGDDLLQPPKKTLSVIPSEVAFLISNILADNQARTPAFGPSSSLVIPGRTVSVKTGTTDSKRDNWTIGYTPDYVVATWVGNNDNSPMNPSLTSGVTGAAPIWNRVMTSLLKDKEDKPYTPPSNVVSLPCYGRPEYFIKGTEPKNGCAPIPTFIFTSPSPNH